ncbi:MAG: cytochrome c [Proteobacteria bacterium]|nr:cytochrome c [Pseudomonadota bacterium]MBU1139863.1 cytochrome c [Pseudomonadota bacterium]MBU1232393.1 cytochrome c [Pseudomonadota bacterium]MBU1417180.1 cytochrome c [Pseudomonadota bacterium]MBU1453646.1 cytochrome c [Pseudomonadota bacterium]
MTDTVVKSIPKAFLLFLAGSCLFALSCTAPPEGNGSDGARWFAMQHCNGCHGKDGAGGRAPEIRGVGLSYGELQAKVRNSGSAIMPSYSSERLSDKEIADIFVFLEEVK